MRQGGQRDTLDPAGVDRQDWRGMLCVRSSGEREECAHGEALQCARAVRDHGFHCRLIPRAESDRLLRK